MPAGRFVLLDAALAEQTELDLPPDVAHQVRDVLRATPGAIIHLLDGRGATYPAEVADTGAAAGRRAAGCNGKSGRRSFPAG